MTGTMRPQLQPHADAVLTAVGQPGSVELDRNTTVRSESFKFFPERTRVSSARPGSPVEALLVGHSLAAAYA